MDTRSRRSSPVPRSVRRGACAIAVFLCGIVAAHPLRAGDGGAAPGADRGFVSTCREAFRERDVHRLFEELRKVETAPRCTLESVRTRHARTDVQWEKGGTKLPAVVVGPSRCVESPTVAGRSLSAVIPPDLERACPQAAAGVRRIVRELRLGEPFPIREGSSRADTGTRDFRRSSERLARGALIALVLLLLAVGWREAARIRRDGARAGTYAAGAVFLAALAARLLVRPNLANWYVPLAHADGTGWPRFGPGAFAFQWLLGAVLPRQDTTLFTANVVLGALAAPLALSIGRRAGIPLVGCIAAATVVALDPLHVRVSASTSAHVLASTSTLAAILSWVAGAQRGDPWLRAVAVVCVLLAILTRIDCFPQQATIPLWALAAGGASLEKAVRREKHYALAFWALLAGVGAYGYYAIAVPSRHPMPDGEAIGTAARSLLSQYSLAFRHPYWMSPVAVILAAAGLALPIRRHWKLTATVILQLLVTFVPLGRVFGPDELVGARYLLAAIAVLALVSGLGFWCVVDPLTRWWKRGREERGRAAALSVAGAFGLLCAGATVGICRDAYRYRYTFQDEYTFLRAALARVPDGCTIYQLPLRQDGFQRDLDCCLDLPESPLRLRYPKLRFARFDVKGGIPRRRRAASGSSCDVYYESAVCSFRETAVVRERDHEAYRMLRSQCARLDGPFSDIAEEPVSPHSTTNFFDGHPPRVRLRRFVGGQPQRGGPPPGRRR